MRSLGSAAIHCACPAFPPPVLISVSVCGRVLVPLRAMGALPRREMFALCAFLVAIALDAPSATGRPSPEKGSASQVTARTMRSPQLIRDERLSAPEILEARDRLEMTRIHARAISARVVEVEPARDGTNKAFVDGSVRHVVGAYFSGVPVTGAFVDMPSPGPARAKRQLTKCHELRCDRRMLSSVNPHDSNLISRGSI